MSLTVAVGLSGIDMDWGNEMKEMYRQSSMLFPKSPSASSLASSSYYSMEGGGSDFSSRASSTASSVSPDSAAFCHSMASIEQLLFSAFNRSPESALKVNKLQLQIEPAQKTNEDDVPAPLTSLEPDADNNEPEEAAPEKEAPPKELNIMYRGRNMLDLGLNISDWRLQSARMPDNVAAYFEHRSQYSRLQGVFPPTHVRRICPDCGFIEPIYL